MYIHIHICIDTYVPAGNLQTARHLPSNAAKASNAGNKTESRNGETESRLQRHAMATWCGTPRMKNGSDDDSDAPATDL